MKSYLINLTTMALSHLKNIKFNLPGFLVVLIVLLQSCAPKDLPLTTLKIEDPVRKYYPILQGQKQQIIVKVTNTGKNPLKIYDVYPSCGCTIAKYPKRAIPAGDTGTIVLEYDSNKNIGYVGIHTTLKTNTKEGWQSFFFEINVVPDPHYTPDYEELYAEYQKNNRDLVQQLVDGKTNERGYEVPGSERSKFQ